MTEYMYIIIIIVIVIVCFIFLWIMCNFVKKRDPSVFKFKNHMIKPLETSRIHNDKNILQVEETMIIRSPDIV